MIKKYVQRLRPCVNHVEPSETPSLENRIRCKKCKWFRKPNKKEAYRLRLAGSKKDKRVAYWRV